MEEKKKRKSIYDRLNALLGHLAAPLFALQLAQTRRGRKASRYSAANFYPLLFDRSSSNMRWKRVETEIFRDNRMRADEYSGTHTCTMGKNRIIPCRVSEFLRFFFLHRRPSVVTRLRSTNFFFFFFIFSSFFFVNPKYRNVKSTRDTRYCTPCIINDIRISWKSSAKISRITLNFIYFLGKYFICENLLGRKFT